MKLTSIRVNKVDPTYCVVTVEVTKVFVTRHAPYVLRRSHLIEYSGKGSDWMSLDTYKVPNDRTRDWLAHVWVAWRMSDKPMDNAPCQEPS